MPIVLNGSGPVTGVTSLNTTVSDTEIGYLDGVTSAIQSQINTAGGLVKITDQSFSAASSVSVNNCFSSTYANYRLVLAVTGSASAYINYRMRAAAADDSSSNYVRQEADYSATTATLARGATTTQGQICYATAALASFIIDVFGPAAAQATQLVSIGGYGAGTPSMFLAYNNMAVASAFDGITIYPTSGTITGTVRVYGYRN